MHEPRRQAVAPRPRPERARQIRLILAFLLVLATGCAGSVVLVKGAAQVRALKEPPREGGKPITVLQAVHGSGCGLLGTLGNYEGALNILRNQAAEAGANYVHITHQKAPYSDGQCRHNEYVLEGTAYRVAGEIADENPPSEIVTPTAQGQALAAPGAIALDSVKSLCGSTTRARAGALSLPARPCDYLLEANQPNPRSLVTLSARLLGKSRYGVFIGGLAKGVFSGFGVEYDAAAGGLSLARRSEDRKLVTPIKASATNEQFHEWRIARTGRRVLVWFDSQLVASEPAPHEGQEIGLQTEAGQLEIRNARIVPLEDQVATSFERLPAVSWGEPVLESESTAESSLLAAEAPIVDTTPEPTCGVHAGQRDSDGDGLGDDCDPDDDNDGFVDVDDPAPRNRAKPGDFSTPERILRNAKVRQAIVALRKRGYLLPTSTDVSPPVLQGFYVRQPRAGRVFATSDGGAIAEPFMGAEMYLEGSRDSVSTLVTRFTPSDLVDVDRAYASLRGRGDYYTLYTRESVACPGANSKSSLQTITIESGRVEATSGDRRDAISVSVIVGRSGPRARNCGPRQWWAGSVLRVEKARANELSYLCASDEAAHAPGESWTGRDGGTCSCSNTRQVECAPGASGPTAMTLSRDNGAAALASSRKSAPAASAGCDIQKIAWAEHEYPASAIAKRAFTLKGGLVRIPSPSLHGFGGEEAGLEMTLNYAHYADVDDDGKPEAFVSISAPYYGISNGSSIPDEVQYVFKMNGDCALQSLGYFQPSAGGAEFQGGAYVVDAIYAKAGDGTCCPSGRKREEWRLVKGRMKLVSSETLR
jgi:hypothetical protein